MRADWAAIVVATVLTTVFGAGRARAQPFQPPPAIPIEVEAGAPDATVRITGLGVDVPCGARCRAEVPAGQYRVQTTAADGRASARNVFIDAPSRLTVTPHNQTARVTGIVMMPVGIGSAGVGLVLLWWAGLKWVFGRLAECSGDCTTDIPSWLVPTGLAALGVGVAVGLTGLVLWRSNAHAGVQIDPLSPPQAPRAQLRLRPVSGLHWSGLALTAAF
jgi:hypothetical protein